MDLFKDLAKYSCAVAGNRRSSFFRRIVGFSAEGSGRRVIVPDYPASEGEVPTALRYAMSPVYSSFVSGGKLINGEFRDTKGAFSEYFRVLYAESEAGSINSFYLDNAEKLSSVLESESQRVLPSDVGGNRLSFHVTVLEPRDLRDIGSAPVKGIREEMSGRCKVRIESDKVGALKKFNSDSVGLSPVMYLFFPNVASGGKVRLYFDVEVNDGNIRESIASAITGARRYEFGWKPVTGYFTNEAISAVSTMAGGGVSHFSMTQEITPGIGAYNEKKSVYLNIVVPDSRCVLVYFDFTSAMWELCSASIGHEKLNDRGGKEFFGDMHFNIKLSYSYPVTRA